MNPLIEKQIAAFEEKFPGKLNEELLLKRGVKLFLLSSYRTLLTEYEKATEVEKKKFIDAECFGELYGWNAALEARSQKVKEILED